jgi:hypothetical protein
MTINGQDITMRVDAPSGVLQPLQAATVTTLVADVGTYSSVGKDALISEFVISPGAWKLPADHSMSMVPMMVIYPHPAAGVNARHLWAHTAFEYRIPVGVKGGAYPYRYELLSAPAGATIGEEMDRTTDGITGLTLHTPGEFYGVIRWTPGGAPRTESFSVLVTDQNDASVQLDWDVEVDDTKFVIIQQIGGTPGGAGTWADPLQTLDDWYKGDNQDSTYVGRIPVLRAGSYEIIPDTSDPPSGTGNDPISLNPNYKARAIIGVPGDMPVVDMTRGGISCGPGNCDDYYISGLRLVNGQTIPEPRNTQAVTFHQTGYRVTFFELEFDNIQSGYVGTDNPGCIVSLLNATNAPGTNYIYLCKNTYSNIDMSVGGNGGIMNFYNSSFVLIERQIAVENCRGGNGFELKCNRDNYTVRYNEVKNSSSNQCLFFAACTVGSKPDDHFDIEFCYNKVVEGVNAGHSTLNFALLSGGASGDHNLGAYRNTLIGGSTNTRDWSGIRPRYLFDGNVIISNENGGDRFYNVDEVLETYPSLRGDGNADYANLSTGDLQNSSQNWRDMHLGKIGSEIAG